MAHFPTTDELAAAAAKHGDKTSHEIFSSLEDALFDSTPARPQLAETAVAEFRADGEITDPIHARSFMTAGRATVTLVSKKTGVRFTYKISKPKDGEVDNGFRFVSVLNGPDNWTNYAYFGYIRNGVFFHGRAKARVSDTAASVKAFAWAWQKLAQGTLPEQLQIWHEGKCGRCGRKLTVPSSIASGLGPECAGRMEDGQ